MVVHNPISKGRNNIAWLIRHLAVSEESGCSLSRSGHQGCVRDGFGSADADQVHPGFLRHWLIHGLNPGGHRSWADDQPSPRPYHSPVERRLCSERRNICETGEVRWYVFFCFNRNRFLKTFADSISTNQDIAKEAENYRKRLSELHHEDKFFGDNQINTWLHTMRSIS